MKNLWTVAGLALCAFVSGDALGQSSKDSLLLKERSIDRPVNLHGGQFRILVGYGLSSITKRYDASGNKINLREEGISYVRHAIPISVRYGITEFIEVGLGSVYKRQTQREQEVLSSAGFVFTNQFQIYETIGWEDLSVSLTGRAPLRTRMVDILLGVGAQLPVGSGKTAQPEHSISQQSVSPSATFREIVYTDKPKWGNGAIVGNLEGTVKVRTAYYAATLQVGYQHAMGESEDNLWRSQLIGSQFEYRKEAFQYLLADRLSYLLDIERQLASWFDLSLQIYGEKSSGGWSEQQGAKASTPESSQLNLGSGFEILVTPKIWLRQRIHFSLAGKNSESPFAFTTGFVYNFFP